MLLPQWLNGVQELIPRDVRVYPPKLILVRKERTKMEIAEPETLYVCPLKKMRKNEYPKRKFL
jgi:hypothetical protein